MQPFSLNSTATKLPPQNSRAPVADAGVEAIKRVLETLQDIPGCYQMFDQHGKLLYIGKARSLRKRVASYTRLQGLNPRLRRMIFETTRLEVVLTRNEAEALLLEASLIKRLKPKYNILLRDDKTLPAIKININHAFPRIAKHRGQQDDKNLFFGPFASASDVNTAVTVLQKLFRLRECSDEVLAASQRPCLLYELKRCSAPCVGKISQPDYQQQVKLARDFIAGKGQEIRDQMNVEMQRAAKELRYEQAGEIRDRLSAFGMLRAEEGVFDNKLLEADIIALFISGDRLAVSQLIWRGGNHCGLRTLFPRIGAEDAPDQIMAGVIAQLYSSQPPPRKIIVSVLPDDSTRLAQLLSSRCSYQVKIMLARRGQQKKLLANAMINAEEALAQRAVNLDDWRNNFTMLQQLLQMKNPLQCIEIYDNSHLQGSFAVSAKVVANHDGWQHHAYRNYNVSQPGINRQDDLAMLGFVIARRIKRLNSTSAELKAKGIYPDAMLIDGGKTHLAVVAKLLAEHGLDKIKVFSIAKGFGRRDGLETVYIPKQLPVKMNNQNQKLFFFLLRLRDEAHRFAIGRHRHRRSMAITTTPLDQVAGVGVKRKVALLRKYGSTRAIAKAAVSDLQQVAGISEPLAKRILNHLKLKTR